MTQGIEARPIVVGVDGSRFGRAALRWALAEADRRDCAVRALMVAHVAPAVAAGRPTTVGMGVALSGPPGQAHLRRLEASLRGADLVAVHTWTEYQSDNAYAYARQFVIDWDAIEAREREMLTAPLVGWQEKHPDVAVRRIVTRDRPVRALLEQAADAQLLVVGSRGHGGFTGMPLGSTSQALIYHATCPLLVARPSTDE